MGERVDEPDFPVPHCACQLVSTATAPRRDSLEILFSRVFQSGDVNGGDNCTACQPHANCDPLKLKIFRICPLYVRNSDKLSILGILKELALGRLISKSNRDDLSAQTK